MLISRGTWQKVLLWSSSIQTKPECTIVGHMSELNIKNMVCDRCIMTVQRVLEDLGYEVREIALGEVEIAGSLDEEELDEIHDKLQGYGFELIQKGSPALVEKIKSQLIHYRDYIEENENTDNISTFLTDKLHHNYSYLSNLFSGHEGITIEQYLIRLKIERVKELLSYEDMTLSEIAWKLNYSSVQYLSNQFKSVTGETVSSFRKHNSENPRKSLDALK